MFLVPLLVAGLVSASAALGWFRPADDLLRDLRFALDRHDPTGSIVLVEIDPESLEAVGVWPWPRRVHAEILNRLMELGAGEVAFDIDFSVPSNEADDALFEAALEDAGGYAMLAAFRQMTGADGRPAVNLPLPRFSRHAQPVVVNVATDGAGSVRYFPYALDLGGETFPSLASALAQTDGPPDADFVIDYAVDATAIDRISVADILAGNVDAARVANRQVVIGASALELRDVMVVPKHGAIPGSLIQILATETLKLGRALQPLGLIPPVACLLCFGLIGMALRERLALPAGLAGAAVTALAAEAAAFGLQARMGLLLDTAPMQMGLSAIALCALAFEAHQKRRLHAAAARERQRAEEQIAYLGRHDALTGAYSRHELVTRLGKAPFEGGATLVALSLGRFTRINEALGHAVGDLVLQEAARRIRNCGVECIARLGGDSFVIALPGVMDIPGISTFCTRLRDSMGRPFEVAGHGALVACRIGVTTTALSGTGDQSALLSHADMAQAAAQAAPALPFVAYSPEMEERVRSTRELELALRQAITERQLGLAFQPQVDLLTGRVVGAEALARWRHPRLGDIPPSRFIAVAEETGLVVELGTQVLEVACAEAATWPSELRVAVNVSPMQFEFDDLVERVRNTLERTGLDPARLDLEITEGTFLSGRPAVIETLERLRGMAVGIALDDFGTGYSSLSYLSRLPVDKLKIDQSFVRRLTSDQSVEAIVETMLDLCRRLDKSVVAEGVETAEQRNWLQARHCGTAQGYLFGRPMPAAEFLRLRSFGVHQLVAWRTPAFQLAARSKKE